MVTLAGQYIMMRYLASLVVGEVKMRTSMCITVVSVTFECLNCIDEKQVNQCTKANKDYTVCGIFF